MKKTQLVDSLRNIKKQIVSYLSVVFIALLASSIFLSVSFASRTIFDNADRYYTTSSYCDAEIYYNSGLRQSDIDYFGNIEGVRASEGEFTYSCTLQHGDSRIIVDTVSLTEQIDIPAVIEGRLPESPDECAIEQFIADELSVNIGDSVSFINEAGIPLDLYPYDEYEVTGIIYHPDNLCVNEYTHNNPVVSLPLSGFDEETRQGIFTSVLLSFDNTQGLSRFSREYTDIVNRMRETLTPYLDEEATVLYSTTMDLYEEYRLRIEDGRVTLQEAEEQISDGREQLADAQDQLESSRLQLEDSAIQLENGRETLDESEIQLASAEQQLAEGWQELQTNLARLEAAEEELAPYQAELDAANAELESTRLQLEDAEAQLQSGEAQIQEAAIQLDAGRQQLEQALEDLNTTQAVLDALTEVLPKIEAELTDYELITSNYRPIIADALHQELAYYIGDYTEYLDWTVPTVHVDYHDPDAHVYIYPVTNSITIDVSASPEPAIEEALCSTGLSEDELRDRYSSMTGEPAVLAEGYTSWYQYIAIQTEIRFFNNHPEYTGEFFDAVTTWEFDHDVYKSYPSLVETVQEGWNEYYAGLNEYNARAEEFNRSLEYFNNSEAEYNAGRAQYEQGLATYNQGLAEYQAARSELDAGWAAYNEGLDTYNAARAEFDRNQEAYEEGRAEYEEGLASYNEGLEAYEEGLAEYDESYAELIDAEERYAEGVEELESSEETFNNLTEIVENTNEVRYLFTDDTMNASYKIIERTGSNLNDIGRTFTLVFVIIAALVIYATLGRIVDEQRNQVGTTKALGFLNFEILKKYLIFGLSGTIIGTVLGVITGYFIILPVVMKGYNHNYVYGTGILSFIPLYAVASVAAGILLSLGTIIFACFSMLKSTAIVLLAERVPVTHKGKNKAVSKGPLYPKLILLNLLSDKKRVIATIVSILGCTTLLTAGFTLRNGINNAIVNQFDQYEHYDYKIRYNVEKSETAAEDIAEALIRNGAVYENLSDNIMLAGVSNTLVPVEIVTGNLDNVDRYFTLCDSATGEHIDSSIPGIWINAKMSQYYDLSAGDEITVYDSDFTPHTLRIAGFFDAYIGFYSFMESSYYEEVFNEEPSMNAFMVINNPGGEFNIVSDITGIEGVEEFVNGTELKESYLETASSLSMLSILFIAMSAMLAYFILLNLVSMLVNQKKRELTIMRVNGFSLFHTINYVAKELIVCTVIGIIIGLLCGDWLGRIVLGLCESDQLMFDKSVQWDAWGFAILLTLFFTALIATPIFAKIRKLDLSDLTR